MASSSAYDAPNSGDFGYLIVGTENGGVFDLLKFLFFNNQESGAKFLEHSHGGGLFDEEEVSGVGHGGGGGVGVTPDHRWVIVVSIIARKIIKFFGKPLEWAGYVVEFFLNLLSLNGNFMGLFYNIVRGNVEIPRRDSETFISAIGHIDWRIDLLKNETVARELCQPIQKLETGNLVLMDLCMMAAKLAYENAKVVRNVVDLHWKMHFVDFYNCWNDYQKENSTQVFIMCDKPKDANLIIISFRGTEPFDADDWITDFDYSWYEFPKIGKVHMGFLEALGLGSRENTTTFQAHLQAKNVGSTHIGNPSSKSSGMEQTSGTEEEVEPLMRERTAYYAARSKLKDLLKEHKNAKFLVTGHSLGGALAILFPAVLVLQEEEQVMQRLLGIYTYGQPRVGNRQLGRFMEAHLEHPEPKYFRVVYCNDLVARLPYDNKTFLYKHFGLCLYYDSLYVEQNVAEEPNRNYFGWRFLLPEYLNAGWELVRSLFMGYVYGPEYKESWESFVLRVVGLVLPGLSAHSPVDYVNSMRLGRRRSVEMMSK